MLLKLCPCLKRVQLKLEGYQTRLKNGDTLNPDQMVIILYLKCSGKKLEIVLYIAINQFLLLFQDAVGRYEEVVHNLKFARELQTTLCALTQDVRTDPVLFKAETLLSRQCP